ncbi:MAG: DegT/DnrJ/EryC1/StrS family aminotransferase, partial [Chloroflexota bacterium]
WDIRFIFERIGYSSKMNELEAAVGLGSMEIYDGILQKRQGNFAYLLDSFGRFSPYLKTIEPEPHEEIGPHAFPFVVQEGAPFTREELGAFLEKRGVETRTLFASMPTQCAGFKFLGYSLGQFPNAEYIGNTGLHIGIHQDLGQEHLDYFLDTVAEFLTEKGAT